MRAAIPRGRRALTIALWGLAALALAALLWVRVVEPRMAAAATDPAVELGHGDYALAATDGSAFTQATLAGAPSAVFFGFTHCPEVCPTTLADISGWEDALAEDGEALRVFFVTVDPERDTADVLGDYVSWVPGVTGVTGPRAEIDKAIAAFRIYAKKVPLEGGGYTMDHSASVLLFDADSAFFAPIGYQEGEDRALATIRRMLEG